jgi:site-specific DNA-cytosine methylase
MSLPLRSRLSVSAMETAASAIRNRTGQSHCERPPCFKLSPRDYAFTAPSSKMRFNRLGRLIGNAVPVRLGEVIGEALVRHVQTELAGVA